MPSHYMTRSQLRTPSGGMTNIYAGDYRTEIETQISMAKCVIPLWSSASRVSATVLNEVTLPSRSASISFR